MSVFIKAEELNPPTVPMVETDYYKWLEKRNDDYGHYSLRRKYLQSLGFQVGIDFLKAETLETLKTIHQFFYHRRYDMRRAANVSDL